ncbi:hypothetical protein EIP91_011186 [Steccherinum ochraceum]|uniref:Uncharacterized protein n=1 Tax=Steccherinum ochraceum TaxID=92696 RepID=A0A4R0R560_9APHY|nr:hypothetical protein EIP91_011186 [Steccherinum ochraceum]
MAPPRWTSNDQFTHLESLIPAFEVAQGASQLQNFYASTTEAYLANWPPGPPTAEQLQQAQGDNGEAIVLQFEWWKTRILNWFTYNTRSVKKSRTGTKEVEKYMKVPVFKAPYQVYFQYGKDKINARFKETWPAYLQTPLRPGETLKTEFAFRNDIAKELLRNETDAVKQRVESTRTAYMQGKAVTDDNLDQKALDEARSQNIDGLPSVMKTIFANVESQCNWNSTVITGGFHPKLRKNVVYVYHHGTTPGGHTWGEWQPNFTHVEDSFSDFTRICFPFKERADGGGDEDGDDDVEPVEVIRVENKDLDEEEAEEARKQKKKGNGKAKTKGKEAAAKKSTEPTEDEQPDKRSQNGKSAKRRQSLDTSQDEPTRESSTPSSATSHATSTDGQNASTRKDTTVKVGPPTGSKKQTGSKKHTGSRPPEPPVASPAALTSRKKRDKVKSRATIEDSEPEVNVDTSPHHLPSKGKRRAVTEDDDSEDDSRRQAAPLPTVISSPKQPSASVRPKPKPKPKKPVPGDSSDDSDDDEPPLASSRKAAPRPAVVPLLTQSTQLKSRPKKPSHVVTSDESRRSTPPAPPLKAVQTSKDVPRDADVDDGDEDEDEVEVEVEDEVEEEVEEEVEVEDEVEEDAGLKGRWDASEDDSGGKGKGRGEDQHVDEPEGGAEVESEEEDSPALKRTKLNPKTTTVSPLSDDEQPAPKKSKAKSKSTLDLGHDDDLGTSHASSQSPLVSTPAVVSLTIPDWISEAAEYFRSMSNQPAWLKLIDVWLVYEASLGYPDAQDKSHHFPSAGRPDQVTGWLKLRRIQRSPVAKSQCAIFVTELKSWWRAMQPEFRALDDDEWPFSHDVECKGQDWGALRRGGINGMFIVILCISWWLQHALPSADEEVRVDALFAVDDVLWVLEHMIDTNLASVASGSSPKKRAAGPAVHLALR